MANPVIHALVIIAAIIIPGGLVVYLAWRIRNRCKTVKEAKAAALKQDPIEEIRNAFLGMYPKEALRVKKRRERSEEARRRRRRKFSK
jgi:hypothetical protein